LHTRLHTWIDRVTTLPIYKGDAAQLQGFGFVDLFNWLEDHMEDAERELQRAVAGQKWAVDAYQSMYNEKHQVQQPLRGKPHMGGGGGSGGRSTSQLSYNISGLENDRDTYL
jgi:hypothetical protein